MGKDNEGPFGSASVAEGYRLRLEPVIFAPWARRLIDFVGLAPGQVVLDVASGTGVVARAAAVRTGPRGRVIASDISPGMLAHVATGVDPSGAKVETLECSATALKLPDASVDVVLCQQGFPFIPDRAAAAREMRRVLRPGGKAGVAVWLAGKRLEPIQTYSEVLQAQGVPEPFPQAYVTDQRRMSVAEVEQALKAGGFTAVEVATQELELAWPDLEAAVLGITGTPFAPAFTALDGAAQGRVLTAVRGRLTGGDGKPIRQVMTAVQGKGTAG
jgi:ubiquinone/menaquinone biosynthesis C-methylase UbiE